MFALKTFFLHVFVLGGRVSSELSSFFQITAGISNICKICLILSVLRDNVPPVFDDCPIDFPVYTEVGSTNRTIVWPGPNATDATGLPVTLTSNYASGETFSIGNLTVQVIATDTFNNTASCNFTIELIGTAACCNSLLFFYQLIFIC